MPPNVKKHTSKRQLEKVKGRWPETVAKLTVVSASVVGSPYAGEDVLMPRHSADLRALQRAAKQGRVTRIAKGLYINAVDDPTVMTEGPGSVAMMVQRHWQSIAGYLYPGAVVSHRSALEGGLIRDPQNNCELILTVQRVSARVRRLPGLSLVLLPGPGPLPGDFALGAKGLYWSSRARMLLENMTRLAKGRRSTGPTGVEEKLIEILNAAGEDGLNRLRDDARALAPVLSTALLSTPDGAPDPRFEVFNQLISTLLGTFAKGQLTTRRGVLLAKGTPADGERLDRFDLLAQHLRAAILPDYQSRLVTAVTRTHAAFLESYFSNYVEGTRFSIEQAEEIALRNRIVHSRPKDSHDILGVFKLVLHPHFGATVPAAADILQGLTQRHHLMLECRPEVHHGEFKQETNYAGQTRFVEPKFVRGTLLEGAKIAYSIPEGLARAIFYAFLVSEVHPFSDGNGRLSRLLMNAELSRVGQMRIIIPTLFHEQYVDAQRALSRQNDAQPLVRALQRMAQWASLFDYQNLDHTKSLMNACHAFKENPAQFKLLAPDGTVFA